RRCCPIPHASRHRRSETRQERLMPSDPSRLIAALARDQINLDLNSLSTVSERVAAAKPFASAIRFALIGVLALVWPWLPALWAGADGNDDRTYARWMAV